MKKLVSQLSTTLYYLIILLVITGGFLVKGPSYKLELAQINILAIILFLFYLFLKSQGLSPPFVALATNRFEGWQNASNEVLQKRSRQFLLIVFALLFVARVFRHLEFDTNMYDVTFLHQSLFYPFLDGLFHCDVCRVNTYLGEHLSFSLLLLTPLTYFLHSDILVFLFKPLFAASGLWLLLKYGPLNDQKKYWLFALGLFFCSSAFRSAELWDFREDDLGFFFICLMLASLASGRAWLYLIALIATLLTKENYGFSTFFIGVPLIFDKDLPFSLRVRRRLATATFAISISYFLFATTKIIPYVMRSVESSNNILIRFPGLGSTFKEALTNLVTTPSLWWDVALQYFFSSDSLRYVVLLFLPFIYFASKKPLWLIAAAPAIAMNMLTPYPIQRMQIGHYELSILPYLFFAMLMGIQSSKPQSRHILLALLIAFCGFGRSPVFEITRRVSALKNIPEVIRLKQLKPEPITAADSKLLAHISYLPHLRLLSIPDGLITENHEDSFNKIYELNKMQSFAPGNSLTVLDAQQLAFNLSDPWQKFLYDELYPEDIRKQNEWLAVVNSTKTFGQKLCAKISCH